MGEPFCFRPRSLQQGCQPALILMQRDFLKFADQIARI